MRSSAGHIIFALLVAVSCSGAEERPEPAQEAMEMAAEAYTLEVTNTLAHDMLVTAMVGDRQIELGIVPAGNAAFFTINAPETLQVRLRATDPEETRTVTGDVTLKEGMKASWTIE